ncbi:Bug family tripartite tricarboxylate transporter substrate binding protein [Paracraurococcus lichenis]|uniref:Tripartite tricarboxylate transporter substrate binding protein n=1 Tax=Paracraurococcus lichenis TaxID=3064888 RepID=A0ABT9EA76_9PROT|nr:tripartite tricarboxylate transporter substrate binding protein [Paracraurococcus sp. LOR1-02]MDO9713111.1 tripartite tricarboxylate transporter substrate binding protein [Paracraurococcus sp. LOR1-02]
MVSSNRRSTIVLAALIGTGSPLAGPDLAQEPPKPIGPVHLLVSFAQGSNSDVVARLLAEAMQPRLGRPIEVENRVGGSGNVMAEAVARAVPDGSTLGLLPPSFPAARRVSRTLAFDPQSDFTPISLIVTAPVLLHANRDLPARDLRKLGEFLKIRSVVCGILGEGTFLHLSLVLLTCALGGECRPGHDPDPSAVMSGLQTGKIQLYFSAAAAALPAVRAGRARALAVASPRRIAAPPALPTIAETVPGFAVEAWYGLAGPRGLPENAASALEQAVIAATRDPALAGRLRDLGTEPVGSTSAKFTAWLRADDAKWGDATRAAGLATH